MKKYFSTWIAVGVAAVSMCAAVATAQLQKATPEELGRRSMGSPAVPTVAAALPPSTDPRNFAGNRGNANALVVETQGLRNQPAGSKLVERWSKSADGTTLNIESGSVDGSGKVTGRQRTMALGWSSGAQVYEWMCEDYNEEWLPGGTDFDDQVAR
jgi:hypothetical protein